MKEEKIVLEENLPLTVEEEYEALVETIRFTEGFSLLFVECSPQQKTEIIKKIRLDIPQQKIELLSLDKTVFNFYNRVKELPNLAEIDILFVTGLEYSLYLYEEEMKERGWDSNEIISISIRGVPPVLVNLNQQRERFRDDFDICFVFLLPRFAIDYLIKRAPDFFDWRSGLFLFPEDRESLQQESSKVFAKELDDYIEFTRQECKYEWVRIKTLLDEDSLAIEKKADLLVRKASLDRRLKQNEEAILACDEALKIEQNNYKAWDNKGIALENLERYEEALAAYEKALEINPNHHQSWRNKGDALDSLERYEQAITAYEKALEIKPDYHYAWFGKGIVLENLERYEQAITAYEKALEIKPDFHYAWNGKGIVLEYLERYEQAIAAYEKALEIQPDYHYAWNGKGIALRNLERYEQAITAFDKALEFKPDFHYAWNNKGIALRNLERYEQAIAAYDKALEIQPDFHYAWYGKAIALKNLGRYEQAISAYDKALEIQPDYHQAWNDKAIALKNLGRYEQAISAYDKALEIQPDYH
ncbi:MAG: tetratricopeptide repeat protein, partial [Crocosphaera sp.]